MYLLKLQKNHILTQRIELLENESTLALTISQAKENIWVEINEILF